MRVEHDRPAVKRVAGSAVLLVALVAVGIRDRSLAFHAVGRPKRHGDSQIVQCRQRRVDAPSANARNGDLRRPAYANAFLIGM
jgi:hypothetical protein